MESIHGVYSAEGNSWALSGSAGLISGQWKSSSESSPQNSPGSVSSGFFPTPSSSPGQANSESSKFAGSRSGIFGISKTGNANSEMPSSGNFTSGSAKPESFGVSRASMARFSLNDYPLIVDWEKTFSDQTRKSSSSSQATLTLKDTKSESNPESKVKPKLNSGFGVISEPKLGLESDLNPKSSKSELKPGHSGNIPDQKIDSNNRFSISNLADEVQIAQMNRQATVVRACRTKSRRAKGPESKPRTEEKTRETGVIDQTPSMHDITMLCADQKIRRRPSQIRVRKDHWRTEKRHEKELQRLKKGSRRRVSSEVSKNSSDVSKISKEVSQEVFKELEGSDASKESNVEIVGNQLESLKLESDGLYVGIDTETGSSGDRTKGIEKEEERMGRRENGEKREKKQKGREREKEKHREKKEKRGKRESRIKGYDTHTVEESKKGNKKLISGSNEPDFIQEGRSSNQRTTSSKEETDNEQVGETQSGENEVLDLGRELVKGQSLKKFVKGQSMKELRGQSMRELREELIKGELIRQSAEKETLNQISQERRDFCDQFIKRSKNQEAGKSRRQIRLESKSQKSQDIKPQIEGSREAENVYVSQHYDNHIHDINNTQAYHDINNTQNYHDINNMNDSNEHGGIHIQSFNQPFSQSHIQDISNHFIHGLNDHDIQPVQAHFDNHEHDTQVQNPALYQSTASQTTSSQALAYEESISAQQNALRYVRAAERDRQRVLNFPQGDPPKDEYSVIDKDIPPYQAQLHRYLDLMAYDERFSPVLRVNRYLVHGDRELADAIAKFSQFNLIPTNLWSVSHVDERDYERLIPELIPSDP